MAPPVKVHNTSLPLPALQRLDRCLNAQSSNLSRSVVCRVKVCGSVYVCMYQILASFSSLWAAAMLCT